MTEPSSLEDVRSRIDDLDTRLVALLARRQELVAAAAGFKRDEDAVRAPDRVERVVAAVRAKAGPAGLDPGVAEAIWRAMITAFIDFELARHRQSATG
ncbi:chorismate mutase [Paractinoplanes ferrugineus]|nr:chorismate mutase [Actinoplanes ferrugineus]